MAGRCNQYGFDDYYSNLIKDFSNIDLFEKIETKEKQIPGGVELYGQGSAADACYVVLDGWFALQVYSPEGVRQVLDFAVPGGIFGFRIEAGKPRRHAAIALTDAEVLTMSLPKLTELLDRDPRFGRKFCRRMMLAQEFAYAHLIRTTHGQAKKRLAYLVVELFLRLRHRLPATVGESIEWPLTQEIMGEAIGVTHEHVNRILRQFRVEEIFLLSNKTLAILDPGRLCALADVGESAADAYH